MRLATSSPGLCLGYSVACLEAQVCSALLDTQRERTHWWFSETRQTISSLDEPLLAVHASISQSPSPAAELQTSLARTHAPEPRGWSHRQRRPREASLSTKSSSLALQPWGRPTCSRSLPVASSSTSAVHRRCSLNLSPVCCLLPRNATVILWPRFSSFVVRRIVVYLQSRDCRFTPLSQSAAAGLEVWRAEPVSPCASVGHSRPRALPSDLELALPPCTRCAARVSLLASGLDTPRRSH